MAEAGQPVKRMRGGVLRENAELRLRAGHQARLPRRAELLLEAGFQYPYGLKFHELLRRAVFFWHIAGDAGKYLNYY